jgi:hypothetical protein
MVLAIATRKPARSLEVVGALAEDKPKTNFSLQAAACLAFD